MSFAHKTRIGVLRGGPSPEYEVSLNTGKSILSNLPEGYEPVDIFISKNGVWHEKGFEKTPGSILKRVDMIINGLHGKYGEDGEVQKILDSFGVPYTGPRALAAAISMNKLTSKNIFKRHGLKTPASVALSLENISRRSIRDAYESIPAPFVVKPISAGSSVGVFIVSSLPDLEDAILSSLEYSPAVIIEEFIRGKEATCGVIDDFRGQKHYALLPVEIKHKNEFFDYDAKYSDNGAEEICPGNFSQSEADIIKEAAILAHNSLGLSYYSRSDFIVHPKRGVYVLETNSLPGLTEKSLIPKSLVAVGSNLKEFISHLVDKTLGR